MTALMRNGRDRRSGKPVTSAMRGLSARFWLGPDQRITSGPAATAAAFKGRIHGCTRPRSLKCPIFPLHRGRRPYMALSDQSGTSALRSLSGVKRIWHETARIDTYDPYVWSGRASQENFVELAVAVLHQCIRPLIGA